MLPAICCTLTDPEEPVRKQGFKVVRGFVDKLEQVSNDPSLREEMEAEVQVTHSEGGGSTLSAAAGWASWAVGAIGAKFYKSSIPPPQQQQQSQQQPDGEKEPRASPKPTPPSRSRETTPAEPDVPKATKDTDGWGDADDDDWGSLEESFKATKIEPEPVRPAEPTRRATATTNKVEAVGHQLHIPCQSVRLIRTFFSGRLECVGRAIGLFVEHASGQGGGEEAEGGEAAAAPRRDGGQEGQQTGRRGRRHETGLQKDRHRLDTLIVKCQRQSKREERICCGSSAIVHCDHS